MDLRSALGADGDPQGFGMYPLVSSGSNYRAATAGASYRIARNARIRAEFRHDEQYKNNGIGVFNGRFQNNAFSTNLTVWF